MTLADIDLGKKTINIDHQLQRKGNGELYILDGQSSSAKTKPPFRNTVHLQYYMGHSDISVTMKHYVHTKTEDTRQEGLRMMKEGKLAYFR